MPTGKTIQANGLSLFYEAFGSRYDPTVLLVMGNSAPGLVWPEAFCERLAGAGLHVIRFDARDTGLSTFIDFGRSPYTLDDLADDAWALLDELVVDRAHVAGLSQGGVVGYKMALRQPQRLTSLAVLMSSPDLRPKNDAFAGAPVRTGELPRPSMEYVAQVVALNAHAPVGVDEMARRFVDNFRLAAGPRSPFDESAWHALGRAFAQWPLQRPDGSTPSIANHSNHALAQQATEALGTAQLSAIVAPVLVVHGSDDPIFPVEHARWVAATLPNATLQVVERMGHAFDPAFFGPVADSLARFFRQAQTGGA